jgi:CheY-like chemotaxis protein
MSELSNPAAPPGGRGSLTILAVDDDALVLMSTSAMIEDLGYSVLEATSGRQALTIMRDGASVDLVITDQQMPDMTGVELAVMLKQEWPNLPVVLATGYNDLPPGSPAFPMIGKPFSEQDIERMISDAMAGQTRV